MCGFLKCQAGIDVLFHENSSAVYEALLLNEVLHNLVVSVGINP